jgi:hypothetical protein
MDSTLPRCLVTLLACGLAAVGRGDVQTLSTDPASGIKVEVEGWAGLNSEAIGRDAGLTPVTVTITNGSPAAHVWTVAPRTGYGSSADVTPSARIAVAAGATGRATLFVGTSGQGWGGHRMFQVTGAGMSDSFHILNSASGRRGGGSPSLSLEAGISREVQVAQGNPFATYTLGGQALDMARAPEDWRGWAAFRNLLLTEGEWQGLAGGRRKALLDWAAIGGRAGVLVADRAADRLDRLGFPAAGPDGRRRIGAGEVLVVPWDGTNLEAKEVAAFLAGRTTLEDALGDYHPASKSSGMRSLGATPTGGG